MMAGDEEEHAVLLANYFLYMKKITWLIIGKTFIRPVDVVEKITLKKKLRYLNIHLVIIESQKFFLLFWLHIYIYRYIDLYI